MRRAVPTPAVLPLPEQPAQRPCQLEPPTPVPAICRSGWSKPRTGGRYPQRSHPVQKPPSEFASCPRRSIGVDARAPSARLSGPCCADKRAHKDLLTNAASQSALHPHKATHGGGIYLKCMCGRLPRRKGFLTFGAAVGCGHVSGLSLRFMTAGLMQSAAWLPITFTLLAEPCISRVLPGPRVRPVCHHVVLTLALRRRRRGRRRSL